MKRTLNIFTLTSFLYCNVIAQTNKYFNKHWGDAAPVANFAISIVQLVDSSYFITSESNTPAPNTNVKHVFKFDKNGVILSSQSDSDLTFLRAFNNKLTTNTSKSNFYLGSQLVWTDSNNNYKGIPYVYHFDSLGHFLNPFIAGDTSNINLAAIYSIVYSQSNELLCSGMTRPKYGAASVNYRASYWKVDTLGNTIWEKRDSSGTCCVREFITIKEDNAHNFIMLGTYMRQSSATAAERLWLRKIDTNGNTLWDYKYREPDPDTTDFQVSVLTPSVLAMGNDGNYIVGATFRYNYGFPGRPSALVKFSAVDGHVIWRYNLKLLDTTYTPLNAISKIIPIPNEGYVLFGSITLKNNDWQGFIIKVNENGQELWRKTYGIPKEANGTTHVDYLNDGIQTLDGGFAAVGQTDCAGCGVDAWLVKTNCNGDTAAPVAQFNSVINAQNNTMVNIHNQSLRFDTCIFDFGDNSPLVYKSYLDTAAFTHTYPSYATNYNIICTAKACNQEWDTSQVPIFTSLAPSLREVWGGLEAFRLVPNPASSDVNIVGSTTFTGFEIYNAQGLLVEQISTKPIINYQLSIVNYPKGIYILKVTDKSSTLCLKLVVE